MPRDRHGDSSTARCKYRAIVRAGARRAVWAWFDAVGAGLALLVGGAGSALALMMLSRSDSPRPDGCRTGGRSHALQRERSTRFLTGSGPTRVRWFRDG